MIRISTNKTQVRRVTTSRNHCYLLTYQRDSRTYVSSHVLYIALQLKYVKQTKIENKRGDASSNALFTPVYIRQAQAQAMSSRQGTHMHLRIIIMKICSRDRARSNITMLLFTYN